MSMSEEIRLTIVTEKGEEYYEKWLNLLLEQRQKTCLIIYDHMGQQRSFSEYTYNSMVGHNFVIGQYTGQIIDCVEYSTLCNKCKVNSKHKETTIMFDIHLKQKMAIQQIIVPWSIHKRITKL